MDELEQQAQEAINAHYSGTNEEADKGEETQTEGELGDTKEPETKKPMTKAEENFAKILSEKNKAKAEKESLSTRVSELENTIADKDFYSQYPKAQEFKAEIDAKRAEFDGKLSRDDAWAIISSTKGIKQTPPKGVLGHTPPNQEKSIDQKSSAELKDDAEKALKTALYGE